MIECFSHLGINLIERLGRNFIVITQHTVCNGILTKKGTELLTKDGVSVLIVDVLDDRNDIWEGFRNLSNDLVNTENFWLHRQTSSDLNNGLDEPPSDESNLSAPSHHKV